MTWERYTFSTQRSSPASGPSRTGRGPLASMGFTLVEILIVVVLLGILAATVLPAFSNAAATARASMLADDLRILRVQCTVFKSQHIGVAPGYPGGNPNTTPTEAAFILHMTKASDADCQTAAPGTEGYDFGPYLSKIPENPVNGKSTVQIIANGGTVPSTADDSHGWIYQPSTLTLKADGTGSDEHGKAYIDY